MRKIIEYCNKLGLVLGNVIGYDGKMCRDCKYNKKKLINSVYGIKNNDKTILIKYLKTGVDKIELFEIGDWIDLRVAEDITLKAGDFKLIPLGVAMKLPKNYEALVIPRSSTFMKYGIIQANGIGLIDESYCGNNDEWYFPAYATRDISIPKNKRICQFRIIEHQPRVNLVEVKKLILVDRGGFGTTGEK